ncbi:histone deacetylase 6-like [Primulina eburnea]|uniref:histone deacetylase 6-like n=1 Tax=Primulina eburnea TaxID=1245227 RepID=UPI003C6C8A88
MQELKNSRDDGFIFYSNTLKKHYYFFYYRLPSFEVFNVPLLVLGGGGYTIRNVARCWCYEISVAVDTEPDDNLPYNDYYEYFGGPDYTLHVEPCPVENMNTDRELEKMRNMLLDQLSKIVPSVPFRVLPPTTEAPEEREEDMEVREKPRIWNGELDYESEGDENENSL